MVQHDRSMCRRVLHALQERTACSLHKRLSLLARTVVQAMCVPRSRISQHRARLVHTTRHLASRISVRVLLVASVHPIPTTRPIRARPAYCVRLDITARPSPQPLLLVRLAHSVMRQARPIAARVAIAQLARTPHPLPQRSVTSVRLVLIVPTLRCRWEGCITARMERSTLILAVPTTACVFLAQSEASARKPLQNRHFVRISTHRAA
jgi:hypothetical protein